MTKAWLALAHLAAAEHDRAEFYLEGVLDQLDEEGYGGDTPEQEVWWIAHRVWKARGMKEQAREGLERAHSLVQEQADRIDDPNLRTSFLEQVPVNREIVAAWTTVEPDPPGKT